MEVQWTGGYNVNGLQLQAINTEPIKTPAGVLATRAVETKAGWVGQIVVDKEIVWESKPVNEDTNPNEDYQKVAVGLANERVMARLRKLVG